MRVDELPTCYDARVGGASKVGVGDAVRGFAGAFDVIVGRHMGRYLTR
jgi:hypothetical protein